MYTAKAALPRLSATLPSPLKLPCLCPCYASLQGPLPKLYIAPDQTSLLSGICPTAPGVFMVVLFKSSFHKTVIRVMRSHSTMGFSAHSSFCCHLPQCLTHSRCLKKKFLFKCSIWFFFRDSVSKTADPGLNPDSLIS